MIRVVPWKRCTRKWAQLPPKWSVGVEFLASAPEFWGISGQNRDRFTTKRATQPRDAARFLGICRRGRS